MVVERDWHAGAQVFCRSANVVRGAGAGKLGTATNGPEDWLRPEGKKPPAVRSSSRAGTRR